jgi:ADP-heptose:LPS heptosyltransferase
LKNKYPDAELHYTTKKSFASILEANPYIHQVHTLKDSLSDLLTELKDEQFDYVIDLHHNQRTLLIKNTLGVQSFSFNKINVAKWLMVNFKVNRLPKIHIVDRYLEACKNLGVENDGKGLDYFIPGGEEVAVAQLPDSFQQGYLAWVIGAKHNTKKFPVEKIIRVIRQMNLPVVLLGGKEDTEDSLKISTQLPLVYNAVGRYSLNQSASLLQQSKLVVANDTGLMHIAAAFKKPIVSLWGNTIPEFGMSPYYGNLSIANHIIEVENLRCRPCSKIGYSACPKKHFNCMNQIDEEMLKQTIQKFWTSI